MEWNQLVKVCRNRAGLTQKELGKRMHISQNAISQYETGKRMMDSDTLSKFMEFYELEIGVNIDKLKLKHTDILTEWNREWKLLVQENNHLKTTFSESEWEFINGIILKEAHWFNTEDEEDGYHVSVIVNNKEYCIQKDGVYFYVSTLDLALDVFSKESVKIFEDLWENFDMENKLYRLYR